MQTRGETHDLMSTGGRHLRLSSLFGNFKTKVKFEHNECKQQQGSPAAKAIE